jgi:hypothetical protein
MVCKDDGNLMMSVKAAHGCCVLLLGCCMFNLAFTSTFGFLFAKGVFNGIDLHPFASRIHFGTAPMGWFLLALVVWRAIVTPLHNVIAQSGASQYVACFLVVSVCMVVRLVISELCSQIGPDFYIYYRIAFYAPFYAAGVATDHLQLANANLCCCSTVLTFMLLLCNLTSAFIQPCDTVWCQHADHAATIAGSPPDANHPELVRDSIVQFVLSMSFVVTLLAAFRNCELETVGAWGTRTLTAYLLNFPLMALTDNVCAGTLLDDMKGVVLSILIAAVCCSKPVDIILAPLVRPKWLLDMLWLPLHSAGAKSSTSETSQRQYHSIENGRVS